MNITPEFVYVANRVFDDTETLIARFAAQLQSTGAKLMGTTWANRPAPARGEYVKR